MEPDCFLGLDLGTSGCRAVAIDDRGQIRAQARAPLPGSRRAHPDASEQDPADWWQAAVTVLGELAAQRPGRIRALSIDGTSSTLLLCDAAGEPLTPALMYDDRQARRWAGRIAAVAPPNSPALGPGSALAKLLYLLERSAADRAAHALHQADWVAGRLLGRYGLSDENNALKLGYDPASRRWPGWLARLPLARALLPEVRPVGSRLGVVAPRLASRLGLPPDLVLAAGTTDSNAATLAAGADAPGDAVTSLGSTLVLKVRGERPVFAARYGVYSHRIGDQWLIGGASNSGGAVLRQYFSDARLAELSARLHPDRPLGLDYYPLPGPGERFPRCDPDLAPRIAPRPADDADFLQALLEGIAEIEAEGYARLAALGAPHPRRVLTAGGGAVNEAWRQIRERRLGVPVSRAAHTEAAYGAALVARAGFLAAAKA